MSDITSKFIINGGNPLHGRVKVSGAKNSATKLMIASLLTSEKCTLYNSPNKISDIIVANQICKNIGSYISEEKDKITIQTEKVKNHIIPAELGNNTRIAVLLAGPLLHRIGKAEIPIPGGCKIGSRPVNFNNEKQKK